VSGELGLEGSDFRPLSQHSAREDALDGGALFLPYQQTCRRY
jgi:hypothetical protein